MALTIGAYNDSASISTSEYSLPNDTTSGVPSSITTDGIYAIKIYGASLVAADQFRFRIYEKILSGGTQRVLYECFITGLSPALVFPSITLGNGWDITLLKVAGTDRTFEWNIDSVS